MNREQQRFQAAVAAMRVVMKSPDAIRYAGKKAAEAGEDLKVAEVISRLSVIYADQLLAELDRTKPEPQTPQTDADGWIPHQPTDLIPRSFSAVKFRDGDIREGEEWVNEYLNPIYKDWWDHSSDKKRCHIVAFKP